MPSPFDDLSDTTSAASAAEAGGGSASAWHYAGGTNGKTIHLSEEESNQLLRGIAQLADNGLPLDQGLEAFAEEVSSRRLKQAFRQLAFEISLGGNPLVERSDSVVKLSPYHQSILVAGIQSGNLGETLAKLLEDENWRVEYWRNLRSALAYPLLLVVLTMLVVDLLNVVLMPLIQREFIVLVEDFQFTLPFNPDIFRATPISWFSFLLLGGVGVFLITLVLPVAQLAILRRSLPLLGKVFWYYETLDLVLKLQILLVQRVPVVTALRRLQGAVSSRQIEQQLQLWAQQVEQGQTLAQVWQESPDIPPTIVPLVRWGEQTNALAEGLHSASRVLKERLELRRQLIIKVAPPLITTLVLAALFWAGLRMVAIFTPLYNMMLWNGSVQGLPLDVLYHLQNLWMAVLLGVVLLILCNQWDMQAREKPRGLRKGLRLTAWTFLGIGGVGWWLGVSGPFGLVVVPGVGLLVIGFAVRRYRLIENRSFISVVTAGMDKGIPPIVSAVAYEQEATGIQQRKADTLAKALGAGMSVTDAAARAGLPLPAETVVTLELGRNLRLTPEKQKRHEGTPDTVPYGNLDALIGGQVIVVIASFLLLGVILFMQLKIAPMLNNIVNEFGISSGSYLQAWQFTDRLGTVLLWLVPVLAPLMLVLLILIVLLQLGWMSELPWGLRWLHGPINECRLLNVLSMVTASEIPLPTAVEVMVLRFPSVRMRRVLWGLRRRLEEGGNWIDALRAARVLGSGEAALARSAEKAGNLAWALSEISTGKQRRHLQRIAPVMKIMVPLLVLLGAIPVLLLALMIFLPMVEILVQLS